MFMRKSTVLKSALFLHLAQVTMNAKKIHEAITRSDWLGLYQVFARSIGGDIAASMI